jgi:hypothetical protein
VPLTPLLAQIGAGQIQGFQRAPAPRSFQTQQVHYLRFTVGAVSCTPPSGLACFVRVGVLPYNAFLTAIRWETTTTYTGGGVTAVGLTLGISTGSGATNVPGAQIMASAAIITAAAQPTLLTTFAGAGVSIVGAGATIPAEPTVLVSSGTQIPNLVVAPVGGFSIYATLTATTGYPTAGQTTVAIEYYAPNDGSCQPFLIDQAITNVAPFTAC